MATTDGSTTDQSSTSSSTPNVLSASDSTVTSDDGLVTVDFPAGTFSQDASCQVNKSGTSDVPVKSSKLIGPYAIACLDNNGNSLNKFNHTVTANISVPPNQGTYQGYVQSNNKWGKVKAKTAGGTLSIGLSQPGLFAAVPEANLTPVYLILGALALLLFGAGGGIYFLIHRRNQQAQYDTYIRERYIEGDKSATDPTH